MKTKFIKVEAGEKILILRETRRGIERSWGTVRSIDVDAIFEIEHEDGSTTTCTLTDVRGRLTAGELRPVWTKPD